MEQQVAVEQPTYRQLVYEAAMCKRELHLIFKKLSQQQVTKTHLMLLRLRLELQSQRTGIVDSRLVRWKDGK